jgi:predicted dehydrogenase
MASRPYKIALVGIENSHATHIIEYLNVTTRRRRAEVVALIGPDDDHMAELLELGGISQRVDDLRQAQASMIGSVDALIATNRDGGLHAQYAIPFLEAGLPVWVDKPLACSTADAELIIEAATRSGAPLTSYSPLRWAHEVDDLERSTAEIGDLQAVTVTGPADPASEYGGLFFYGIHCADVAQRLVPGDPTELQVKQVRGTVIIRYQCGDTEVTLQLVKPDDHRRVPFHATLTGRSGVASTDITLGPGYVEPGIEKFLGMLDSGNPPVPYEEILRPVAVIEAARSVIEAARSAG